ncbi:hypothetical protein HU200_020262 [Digitaria exilis]|uniref:RNase H type-1 domain-containing protein n=1 Tax=Digitaria exilis TaxID=1010633 RepID=A0A835F1L7_9POAL|nr:hypothetical protein HU200_020262 [Digitaria exilis]
MTGAWGYIVRTSDGAVVLAGAGRLSSVRDALCAEMSACLHALSACSKQGMAKIRLESDCLNLVISMICLRLVFCFRMLECLFQ